MTSYNGGKAVLSKLTKNEKELTLAIWLSASVVNVREKSQRIPTVLRLNTRCAFVSYNMCYKLGFKT